MLTRIFSAFVLFAACAQLFSLRAAEKPSQWIKICETPVCLTYHERLDGDSGAVIVSAGIRQREGYDGTDLVIMLQKGMQTAPGIMAAVYSKAQWQLAEKGKPINEHELRPFKLKFSQCKDDGCSAEMKATPRLISEMKTGGGLMILVKNSAGRPLGYPVPLEGFSTAWQSPPTDAAAYKKARSELMDRLRRKQMEALERASKSENSPLLDMSRDKPGQ
jgi:invasion protein IalB